MKKIILAYIPVLHEGYRRFLATYQDADLFIFGPELMAEFSQLAKEIRQLDPELVRKSILSWGIIKNVSIANKKEIQKIKDGADEIIMPDEDITWELKKKYFSGKKIIFDTIFLRWNKHNTTKEAEVHFDRKVSREAFDKEMILLADQEGQKSSDWWRRIGSVVVKNGKIILSAHNKHVPSEYTPYVDGDPRSNFHKGDHLELSTAIHSEAAAIAEAAKRGISLEEASIYVTTFPCSPCAKLIAYSGIKKIYYNIGYGVLDGESVLKSHGVEIIFVDMDIPQKKGLGDIDYKK